MPSSTVVLVTEPEYRRGDMVFTSSATLHLHAGAIGRSGARPCHRRVRGYARDRRRAALSRCPLRCAPARQRRGALWRWSRVDRQRQGDICGPAVHEHALGPRSIRGRAHVPARRRVSAPPHGDRRRHARRGMDPSSWRRAPWQDADNRRPRPHRPGRRPHRQARLRDAHRRLPPQRIVVCCACYR